MYAKVKLPDEFVKGDCENCPLCVYHAPIDDTYDLDGYSNDDGFQDWNECLIKVCNADYPCSNVDGTKDCPQEDCPMEIEYEDLKEKIEIRKNKIGYDMMTLSEKHKIGKDAVKTLEAFPDRDNKSIMEIYEKIRHGCGD